MFTGKNNIANDMQPNVIADKYESSDIAFQKELRSIFDNPVDLIVTDKNLRNIIGDGVRNFWREQQVKLKA